MFLYRAAVEDYTRWRITIGSGPIRLSTLVALNIRTTHQLLIHWRNQWKIG